MNNNKQIPLFLITGFLGSGKTTFLKHFIKKYGENNRIAVVQNEFASVNIDRHEIQEFDQTVRVVEMNSGSVFCVCLLSEFKQALYSLIDSKSFDAIIVEATGLADPVAVTQLFLDDRIALNMYLAHIWTIVDVNHYKKVVNIKSAERQIRLADTVILNKMDSFSGDTGSIINQIANKNSNAEIVKAVYSEIELPNDLHINIPVPIELKKVNGIPAKRPIVDTIVIKDQRPIDKFSFDTFLNEIENKLIRLKGFIKISDETYLVQKTFRQFELNKVNYHNNTEMIIIGTGLENKSVQVLWEKCFEKVNI